MKIKKDKKGADRSSKKGSVYIAELPKTQIPTDIAHIKASLLAMQVSEGWQIMLKIFADNIKYLETSILEKIDPVTKIILTDDDIEKLRNKRNLMIEVRDTPENYVKTLEKDDKEMKNYDPYFQTKEEMDKKKYGSQEG